MTRRNPLSAALTAVAVVLGTFVVFLAPAGALTNCSVSGGDQAVDPAEQELLNLVNEYRVANGRGPLAMDPDVTRAAAWFARDMATKNYIGADHRDSFGRDIQTRLTQCDVSFNWWAENVAWGYTTAQEVFDQWRNSPTHDTNMLRPQVTLAGVGRAFNASSDADWYWVLDLTSPGSGATTTTGPTTTVVPPPPTIVVPTTIPAPPTTFPSSTVPVPTTFPVPTTAFPLPTFPVPTTAFPVPPTVPVPTTVGPTTSTVPQPTTTSIATTSTTGVTVPPSDASCASLLASRAEMNAQITTLQQALARSLSGAELQARIAELERTRALANAQMNALLADAGCALATG